jgi:glutamine---fructose-6-phosphate transaminase (isomerizing)
MSAMRDTMNGQPDALRRVLRDVAPVRTAAKRLMGRRVLIVGTGTSYHAANQGAWLLRMAGVEAWPVHASDAAQGGPAPTADDALVLLSHRGTKRHTSEVLRRAREAGVATVVISRQGNPEADLDTVPEERSSAFTASHLCALLRLAQLASELGAPLPALPEVPDAVAAELASEPTGVVPPARLLEFTGSGINAWTAAEGALKTRETSYVACCGGNSEQLLHGPSVALGPDDALVCLDGEAQRPTRLDDVIAVVKAQGSQVHRFTRQDLGEALSIFPLTTIVQKIAVEAAELKGANPDSFGKDLPGRAEAWTGIQL